MINRLLDINKLDESLRLELELHKTLRKLVSDHELLLWAYQEQTLPELTDEEIFDTAIRHVLVRELFLLKTGFHLMDVRNKPREGIFTLKTDNGYVRVGELLQLIQGLERTNVNALYREFDRINHDL